MRLLHRVDNIGYVGAGDSETDTGSAAGPFLVAGHELRTLSMARRDMALPVSPRYSLSV